MIAQHPVVVFSKQWCPFCKKAKNAIEQLEAEYFVKELENADRKPIVANPEAFQDYLAAKTNLGKSVPKVFIKGECIGGGDDVTRLSASGELLKRCVAAGVVKEKSGGGGDGDVHFFVNGCVVSETAWQQASL